MADSQPWPDVTVVVRAALADLCQNVGSSTPADPEGTLSWLPFVLVECIGGDDDQITDTSHLDVQTFAATKTAAGLLARQVQQRFLAAPLVVPGHGALDLGETLTKPRYLPYVDAPPPWRYVASYTVQMRRPVTT